MEAPDELREVHAVSISTLPVPVPFSATATQEAAMRASEWLPL
jgi:hypothetical protein